MCLKHVSLHISFFSTPTFCQKVHRKINDPLNFRRKNWQPPLISAEKSMPPPPFQQGGAGTDARLTVPTLGKIARKLCFPKFSHFFSQNGDGQEVSKRCTKILTQYLMFPIGVLPNQTTKHLYFLIVISNKKNLRLKKDWKHKNYIYIYSWWWVFNKNNLNA